MGYKIITDSTIDMDHKMIEELGLTVVPLRFTIDGKTYKDKADLSDMPTETFYAKLREGKMSTTSQINADEFTRVFEPVLQGGEDVLYIAFSSGLSGTCQSAFIARDELKEKYPVHLQAGKSRTGMRSKGPCQEEMRRSSWSMRSGLSHVSSR